MGAPLAAHRALADLQHHQTGNSVEVGAGEGCLRLAGPALCSQSVCSFPAAQAPLCDRSTSAPSAHACSRTSTQSPSAQSREAPVRMHTTAKAPQPCQQSKQEPAGARMQQSIVWTAPSSPQSTLGRQQQHNRRKRAQAISRGPCQAPCARASAAQASWRSPAARWAPP
jgi:hypothetical protein